MEVNALMKKNVKKAKQISRVILAGVLCAGACFSGVAVTGVSTELPVYALGDEELQLIDVQNEDIVIRSVTFDKNTATPGDIVNLNIDANSSQNIDKIMIEIIGKNYSIPWNGEIEVIPDDKGQLSYELMIDNSYANGDYGVNSLVVFFKTGDIKRYDRHSGGAIGGLDTSPLAAGSHWEDDGSPFGRYVYDEVVEVGEFNVINSKGEYLGPKLKSVMFDSEEYKKGSIIQISAELEEPKSVVDSLSVVFGYPTPGNSYDKYNVLLKSSGNGKWVGEVKVPVEKDYWNELYGGSPIFEILEVAIANGNEVMYYASRFAEYNPLTDSYEYGDNHISKIKTNSFVIDLNNMTQEIVPSKVSVEKKILVLDKGKTDKLTAKIIPDNAEDKTVSWSSSNAKVATVDSSGNVTAVNHGKAVITAKTSNGKTAACEVRVNFADVASESLYYYKPVYWAAENGITTGSNGLFAPHNKCTREHAITFLWRMAGSPAPKSMTSKFKDITNKSSYSYKAIMWGTENGIITGSNGVFAPNNTCTREQIVTMLWRLAGKPEPKNSVSKFKDVQNKNSYSYKAILWAAEKGITTGANGSFAPGKVCTRAEIVTFIYRYKN